MSIFYKSLPYWEGLAFHRRKKAFKRGKKCAMCGRKFSSDKMMVAHIIPVRELSDYDAMYDTSNWQVRCIYCERRANRAEHLREQFARDHARKAVRGVASYEIDIYADYTKAINRMFDISMRGLSWKHCYRRSTLVRKIHEGVAKADRMTLAKATAKFVLTNGYVPKQEEVFDQMTKDLESIMLFKTKEKFAPEKSEEEKKEEEDGS